MQFCFDFSTHFQLVSNDSLIRLSVEEHYRILKAQIELIVSDILIFLLQVVFKLLNQKLEKFE